MTTPESRPAIAVLVIDDEPQMRRLLRVTLEAHGYAVTDAATGKEGIVQAAQARPEIIVLDLGLPDLDGVEVLKRIREWSRVPIIILSVRDREGDKVAALDAGADDFVTKPFSSAELLARLRTTLRRSQPPAASSVFRSGDLEVDLANRLVRKNGQEIKLTPTEYALLRLLVTHAGKVLTHRQLLTEVWGPAAVEQTHYLRVHIAHLRDKLSKTTPPNPNLSSPNPPSATAPLTRNDPNAVAKENIPELDSTVRFRPLPPCGMPVKSGFLLERSGNLQRNLQRFQLSFTIRRAPVTDTPTARMREKCRPHTLTK